MKQIKQAIQQMIQASGEELDRLLRDCAVLTYSRKEFLSQPGKVCDEIFFINSGIIRVVITDNNGVDHTAHFALENQFIADYGSFLQVRPSVQSLQALEPTEVVVMPRKAVAWGYQNLTEGDKLGRLIAEFYFVYLDNRITNMYTKTPKARYDIITDSFPNIHNRVPQHMIASYLGITSVHLSRLKKAEKEKL